MKQCVESAPITPMQDEWFQNILTMIPDTLKQGADTMSYIDELFEEIRAVFESSMRKSMGECYFVRIFFNSHPISHEIFQFSYQSSTFYIIVRLSRNRGFLTRDFNGYLLPSTTTRNLSCYRLIFLGYWDNLGICCLHF